MKTLLHILICFLVVLFSNCNDNKKSEKDNLPQTEKKDTAKKNAIVVAQKPPIVNIQDTICIASDFLCIKDSASSEDGLKNKLIQIFSKKLSETIKSNKLKTLSSPAVWYNNKGTLYFFEAGIAVDKVPSKMGKAMYMKSVSKDSCFIAHYWGPQSMKTQGYTALQDRMKDDKKIASDSPYEVYKFNMDSTLFKLDPFKQETLIVMCYKSNLGKKEK